MDNSVESILILHIMSIITDQPGQESNDAFVSFKIEPNIIPATAIQTSEKFPAFRGGFGDIWKCEMSTQSEARPVSLQTGEQFPSVTVIYYNQGCDQIHQGPFEHRYAVGFYP